MKAEDRRQHRAVATDGRDAKASGRPQPSEKISHGSAPLSLQACQWRDRQPPVRVREGDGSYFRKPEGLEEGADPSPPLKRLRPPDREEEEERLPYGLPRGGPNE